MSYKIPTHLGPSSEQNHSSDTSKIPDAGLYLASKPLPVPENTDVDYEKFTHQFTRDDVKQLIHIITQELKLKGTKTPLVLLAFRSKASDQKLAKFLGEIFTSSSKPASLATIERAVTETDEYTLVSSLKYLWARLPGNSIIGWEAYESFKNIEIKEKYPKKAFLDFMPQCLSSPSHASIVYDFLDLLVALGASSKENQLSGRKIAKMAGIWAFQGLPHSASSSGLSQDNSFSDGLNDWLPAADAMFHLLLSFLRSMLPDEVNTKLQLPRTLQALLASNSYPPPDLTFSSSTLVDVPLVTIRTNSLSKSPIELINKMPKVLIFDNQNLFEAKEDYALLKSLCRADDNILHKLSGESRRIIEALCHKGKDTNLNSGWVETQQKLLEAPRVEVKVSRVAIDDYFIWAWLCTLSFEQTSTKKKTFGRSLISEVVFDGFKKWIIIEEQNINSNSRNSKPPSQEKPVIRKISQPHYTSMLDGLPDKASVPKKKVTKPQKPLPTIEPKSLPVSKAAVSPVKPKGIFNTLKKLNARKNYGTDDLPILPPKPPKDHHKLKEAYQLDVGSLPEIERDQYRLSIPLESFGFMEEPRTERYSQQQEEISSNRYHAQYDNPSDADYQNYDQRYEEINSRSHFSSNTNEDGHQFSVSERYSEGYTKLRPDPVEHSDYELKQAIAAYSGPFQNYDEFNGDGSMDNLSYMVDQMKVQVGQVETKLGRHSGYGYEYEIPFPKEENEEAYEFDNPQKYDNYSSSPESQFVRVPEVSIPSDIKTKSPAVLSEESSSAERPIEKPKNHLQQSGKSFENPEPTTPNSIDEETERTTQREPVASTSLINESKIKLKSYPIKSMVDVADEYPTTSVPLQTEDSDKDIFVNTPNSSSKNENALQNINSTPRQSLEHRLHEGVATQYDNKDIVSDKRVSVVTNDMTDYPESIIDTYRVPSIYSGRKKPQISPKKLPYPRTELQETNGDEKAEEYKVNQQEEAQSASESDVDYIPDLSNELGPIPLPGAPRSQFINQYKQIDSGVSKNVKYQNRPAKDTEDKYSVDKSESTGSDNEKLHTQKQSSVQYQYLISDPIEQVVNQKSPPTSVSSLASPSKIPRPKSGNSIGLSSEHAQLLPGKYDQSPNISSSSDSFQSSPNRGYILGLSDDHVASEPKPSGTLSKKEIYDSRSNSRSPLRSDNTSSGPKYSISHTGSETTASTSTAGSVSSSQLLPLSRHHHSPNRNQSNDENSNLSSQRNQAPHNKTGQPLNRDRSPRGTHLPKGYPPQGYPPQGYPPQGYPPQGYSPQGYPHQGYPPQGYYPQGYPTQGYSQGPPPQGYRPQGRAPQGHPPQNYQAQGFYPLPPPQGYYPAPQGYYPPPQGYHHHPPQGYSSHGPPQQIQHEPKKYQSVASDFAINNQPTTTVKNKLHHRPNNSNKKDLRNALTQGDFGI
ncbi:hypothetical protein WICMUC_002563 [Wickerhamomyces mucosus]|uniref:Meiotically up-regulated protein Msb1/Mug8 domain-containing protein n=1 Tax=Wickerhamomyces mucosus TaxID=1378264 RepID=A0A9P8TE76_9ASCO|nr:hypothetical protein WICMUC_002563 [Wickerhamomyces mucosus]